MFGSLRLFLVPLAAAGFLALVQPAHASKASDPGRTGVDDGAKLFSTEAVEKADARLKALALKSGHGLFVETMDTVPTAWKKQVEDNRDVAFPKLAEERYKAKNVH